MTVEEIAERDRLIKQNADLLEERDSLIQSYDLRIKKMSNCLNCKFFIDDFLCEIKEKDVRFSNFSRKACPAWREAEE